MARLFPSNIPADAPSSERAVWMVLRNLPDPWHIFHGVEWQGERSGRPGDGEADFVLLHPDHGLIVMEVKGGGIAVRDTRWYSFDRSGKRHEIDDPFEQAKTSKYTLIGHLRSQGEMPFIPAGHCVAFPDISLDQALGLNAPREIIISRPDLHNVDDSIERLIEHWELTSKLGAEAVSKIVATIAPEAAARVTLRDDVVATTTQIEKWTEEQLGALDALRRNDRQMIYGGAGTGKTVLAMEKAVRLATEGKTVLLTCYNHPLAQSLSSRLEGVDRVTVSTFHALCRRLADRAQSTDLSFPDAPTQDFWDHDAADLLVAAADHVGFHVDAVVVDEAQDFAKMWWPALELLLTEPERGEFYAFADTHQAIYRKEWEPPFPGPNYELTRNCRNTRPIAERVAAVFADDVQTFRGPGTDPEFIEVVNIEGAARALRRLMHQLLNEGKLERSQVAILGQRKDDVDQLRRMNFAGHPASDLSGWGEGVLVETVHKFKGLEADVCVLVLNEVNKPWDRALAYIGMSRARAQLYVLGPSEVQQLLGWPT